MALLAPALVCSSPQFCISASDLGARLLEACKAYSLSTVSDKAEYCLACAFVGASYGRWDTFPAADSSAALMVRFAARTATLADALALRSNMHIREAKALPLL